MSANSALNFRNPAAVRNAGMTALEKELGAVGAVYFIRQFESGRGDYTAERDILLRDAALEDIIKSVKEIDAQPRQTARSTI
ncbi:MAG: hypothetical protein LBT26_01540 [Clostridiales Family XIII bacterium]|jgi:hypothetical protein|nr:hypothetical protein [Clostridiales Family XIII bacterium]